jgi:D-alanyl-lipoteichoic acid acyltransferase DltB (MBOAT superfamily)
MIFTSLEFIVFLAVTLLVYNLIPSDIRARFLLVAGYFFYSFSGWQNIGILLAVTLSVFLFGKVLGSFRKNSLLILAVAITIAPLILWKSGVIGGGQTNNGFVRFVIPIGLSFYTLQAIGYLLDVFKQRVRPADGFVSLALFMAFFPIMLAGPVERAGRLIPQLASLSKTRNSEIYIAVKQLLWGFVCKLIVADKLAIISADILNRPGQKSPPTLLIGLFLYSIQIYFDFYGYSTIALAAARLFGVQVMVNFNHPFLASTLVEFWHRWHISLSTWFRDYVYLPLAYKFKPAYSFTIVVFLVFILSGIWHGTSLGFIIWGGVHGFLYIFGRLSHRFRGRLWRSIARGKIIKVRRPMQAAYVFILVSLAWVFFASPRIGEAATILRRIFSWELFATLGTIGSTILREDYMLYIACAIILFALDSLGVVQAVVTKVPTNRREIGQELVLINGFVLLLLLIGDIGAKGFYYMQF